jgi:hypothetical protein
VKRLAVFAVVAALAVLAMWRSLTFYSNVDHGPRMDPTELALARRVLTRALSGDSAGAIDAGASPAAAGWALRAARRDPGLVRGWTHATETTSRAERADTVTRIWFTTAAMQRCSGAAELTGRFLHRRDHLELIELQSPCVPVAPITFEIDSGAGKAR